MSVFGELIDAKVLRILTLLVKNKQSQYHLQKISQDAKVPISSVFRIMKTLVELNLVEQTIIGKLKIYRIASNKKTRQVIVYLKNG
jgi:DNA-binding IclR family transcriptional regulator